MTTKTEKILNLASHSKIIKKIISNYDDNKFEELYDSLSNEICIDDIININVKDISHGIKIWMFLSKYDFDNKDSFIDKIMSERKYIDDIISYKYTYDIRKKIVNGIEKKIKDLNYDVTTSNLIEYANKYAKSKKLNDTSIEFSGIYCGYNLTLRFVFSQKWNDVHAYDGEDYVQCYIDVPNFLEYYYCFDGEEYAFFENYEDADDYYRDEYVIGARCSEPIYKKKYDMSVNGKKGVKLPYKENVKYEKKSDKETDDGIKMKKKIVCLSDEIRIILEEYRKNLKKL